MHLYRRSSEKLTAMDSDKKLRWWVLWGVLLVALPFFGNTAAAETYPFCSPDLPPLRVVSRVHLTDKNKGVTRDLDTVSYFLGPELIICYEWQDVKVVAYQHRLRKVTDYWMRGCDDYIPFSEESFAYRLAVLSPYYYLQMMRYFCDEEQKWSRVDVQRSDTLVTHTVIEPQKKAIVEEYSTEIGIKDNQIIEIIFRTKCRAYRSPSRPLVWRDAGVETGPAVVFRDYVTTNGITVPLRVEILYPRSDSVHGMPPP